MRKLDDILQRRKANLLLAAGELDRNLLPFLAFKVLNLEALEVLDRLLDAHEQLFERLLFVWQRNAFERGVHARGQKLGCVGHAVHLVPEVFHVRVDGGG